MKTTLMILAVLIVTAIAGVCIVGGMWVSYSNQEVRLRVQIEAKQQANQAEFDNLKKKISQSVQVTDLQMSALKDIIVGNATARSNGHGAGTIASWIQESVPNIDTSTFYNLQNIIVGSRDAWTMRQTELIDLNRAHDQLLATFPSKLFVGNRSKIDITVVTSSATKSAFQTGEDNDTNLK